MFMAIADNMAELVTQHPGLVKGEGCAKERRIYFDEPLFGCCEGKEC